MPSAQHVLISSQTEAVLDVPWGQGKNVETTDMAGLVVGEPWKWEDSEGKTKVVFPGLKDGHPPIRVRLTY